SLTVSSAPCIWHCRRKGQSVMPAIGARTRRTLFCVTIFILPENRNAQAWLKQVSRGIGPLVAQFPDKPLAVFPRQDDVIAGGRPAGGRPLLLRRQFPVTCLDAAVDARHLLGDGGAGGVLPGPGPHPFHAQAVVYACDLVGFIGVCSIPQSRQTLVH